MRFSIRAALIATLSLAAFVAAASSASALTVSPTGAYTALSGTTTLRLASNGQTLTCTRSSISATIGSTGSGSIPTGGAVYSNCTNPLLGTFTVVQNTGWTIQVGLLATTPPGVSLTVTVPAGGVTISGPGCAFRVSGTVTLLTTVAGLPATITPSTPLPVIASNLRIDGNNGGPLCGFFPVGLAANYGGTYNLNRNVTVSG